MIFLKDKYNKLENDILCKLLSLLDGDAKKIAERQIQSYNSIQRIAKGREVCFYYKKWGRIRNDALPLFPNKSGDLPLANLLLSFNDTKLECEVFASLGRVFSLEFSKKYNPTETRILSFSLSSDSSEMMSEVSAPTDDEINAMIDKSSSSANRLHDI